LCEADDGSSAEYVTKFRSNVRNGKTGLCFECFAVLLARFLNVPTPEAAIVTIDANLAELVSAHSPAIGARMRASIGSNFGSRYLTGHATLPAEQSLPQVARQTAIDIIAFDALIENVDRRQTNPNLLVKGESVRAFDHETAFAFVYDFMTRSRIDKLSFLREHALYASLRGRDLDLSGFLAALTSITDSDLDSIRAAIPQDFGTSYLDRICDHVRRASAEADDFAMALRMVLR
jgi:hypothetical protein